MKKILLLIAVAFIGTPSFAAPTTYELTQGLVTFMNANNEGDGVFDFLVCDIGSIDLAGTTDKPEDLRTQITYTVLRKDPLGDIDQTTYTTVIVGPRYDIESVAKADSGEAQSFKCPEGSDEVLTEQRGQEPL